MGRYNRNFEVVLVGTRGCSLVLRVVYSTGKLLDSSMCDHSPPYTLAYIEYV
jgi:hypothetical protein